mgnify:CR=1 FL=1
MTKTQREQLHRLIDEILDGRPNIIGIEGFKTNYEPLLKIHDVATRLNIPVGTVRKWTERGQLESLKLGRHVRVEPAVLEAFIEQGRDRRRPGWRELAKERSGS